MRFFYQISNSDKYIIGKDKYRLYLREYSFKISYLLILFYDKFIFEEFGIL